MGKVVYMALQKGTAMKTITFNAPCHIGDTVYYVWARKKNNKYTFKMKKSVACGFLIKKSERYVNLKNRSVVGHIISIPMNCVSTNKNIVKTVYKWLILVNKKKDLLKTKRLILPDDSVFESIPVRSEYELGEKFINRYKKQDTVTGILVRDESGIASVLGEDGGVYSFLELEKD